METENVNEIIFSRTNGKFFQSDADRNNGVGVRKMFKAFCTKCGKECSIPFKPDIRPVYCKDCFKSPKKMNYNNI